MIVNAAQTLPCGRLHIPHISLVASVLIILALTIYKAHYVKVKSISGHWIIQHSLIRSLAFGLSCSTLSVFVSSIHLFFSFRRSAMY